MDNMRRLDDLIVPTPCVCTMCGTTSNVILTAFNTPKRGQHHSCELCSKKVFALWRERFPIHAPEDTPAGVVDELMDEVQRSNGHPPPPLVGESANDNNNSSIYDNGWESESDGQSA